MNQNPLITIDSQEQKTLLQSTPSKKYQVVILLLLDCGLRVSELINLQCQHILFAQNKIKIESTNKERIIPISQRLLKALAEYWTTLNETNPDNYLFLLNRNPIFYFTYYGCI